MKVYIVMAHDSETWWPLDVFSNTYVAEDLIKECISRENYSSYKFKIVVREVLNG